MITGADTIIMNHIFCLMGKSASGKDTIFEELLKDPSLSLSALIPWTTRPIRAKEQDGVEYHFTDEEGLARLTREGRVIEQRTYQTECGPWTYFTVDEDMSGGDRLLIGTLESYSRIRDYYGEDRVIPIYVEVDDGLRLGRALKRECKPGNHKYEEMCRRFLADQRDFSEENLRRAGISRRFDNSGDRNDCIREITAFIRSVQEGQ